MDIENEAVEEVTEDVVTEEAVEAVEGDEAVELDSTETGTVEATDEVVDPFAEYGGADKVKAAHEMYTRASTEDGVVQLFLEAGRSLGLGLKEMESLFGSGAVSTEEPAEEEDPDRLLTFREFQEMQNKDKAAAEQARQEQVNTAALNTINSTLADLGIKAGDPAAEVVLKLGDKHLSPKDAGDPEKVAAAVRRGHDDFVALVEQQSKARVAQKLATKKAVPKSPGGAGAPAAPPADEPGSVTEASARVRKMLGIGG